ncbi:MAG TPA: PKD domain-containing protein [Chitinophagaceae bacterium]|nr:PKD domain-containing protein [Chitinophagaceae bacterium]
MKTNKQIVFFLITLLTTQLSAQQSNFDFVENKGQWNSQVKFMGDVGTGAFYLEKTGFTVLLNSPADLKKIHDRVHGGSNNTSDHSGHPGGGNAGNPEALNTLRTINPSTSIPTLPASSNPVLLHSHAYKVQFEGANEDVQIIPEKVQESYNNYLLGNDPSKWASNCKIYKSVTYRNMYPGIDVRYYADNGSLKYDIVVNPGANAASIAMRYEGADQLQIKNSLLYVKTSVGDVKELAPYSYQFDNVNGKTDVNCKYEIVNGNTVRFKIRSYSREVPLIIDPTIIFSSFSGSKTDNWGFTATPGPDGSLFGGGIVQQNGYPVTPGALKPTPGGGTWDIGLTRFSPDGSSRMYSTFLGGKGDDFPLSMISDPQANLVLMGRTYSTDFPGKAILPPPTGGGPAPSTGADLVVIKLNPGGTGFLGSLRIGGTGLDAANIEDQRANGTPKRTRTIRFYGDDSRGEVILDAGGNIYVATQTQSDDFPMVNPFQPNKAGAQDGVILKLDPSCNNIIFSSYLGGKGDDGVFVMDISPTSGNLYVAGATASTDFPGVKPGVKQTTNLGGGTDGFVTELASNGSGIISTTYLGTNSYDAIYGIKFDKLGYPYIMGISEGSWPVINAAYSNANSHQFIAKLQKDLSDFIYSTVFGSGSATSPNPNISPVAFLVDRCENVYVSGWGGSPFVQGDGGFAQQGTQGMPISPGALKSFTDNKDFYFIVIRKDAVSLLYGSFFGQGGTGASGFGEHVDGGTSRYDQQGVIYQAICANCEGNSFGSPSPPYPTTPGVVGPVNGAGNNGCNLGVVKIAFNFSGVGAGVRAFINGAYDTSGCVPLTVEFRDTVRTATSYEWNFGDGSPILTTKDFITSHEYTAVGDYRVMLVGIDSTTCNIRDTVYTTIRVRNNQAFLNFRVNKLQPCESLSYQFTNTSTTAASAPPFTNQSFVWDFGDGTPRVVAGAGAITHNFAAPGSYNVRLVLSDTNYCNAPDSMPLLLRVAPLVKAQFRTPPLGCVPYTAVFENTSLAGYDFTWDFGDGTTSNEAGATVTHLYTTPGNYTIKLVAIDTNTCNKIDSVSMSITTAGKPTASFTVSPLTPQQNFPYTFTNTSSPDAIRFKWLFGDGDSLQTNSRANVDHQYNASGTFEVLLIAINSAGCPDTARASVVSIIVPKLDLPNAFTPLTNGANSTIYVRGFGIGRMTWRIYNRFGNLVFESNSQANGWDGKYKGVLQPMDVYAYTLEVEFTDGTRASKKGDITLLR